jgi:hypothetical protein
MKFGRKLIIPAALAALITLSLPSFAQDDKERDRMKQGSSVTGCLAKGDTPDQYVLSDQSGQKIVVTGSSDDLSKHAANHTVKITGQPSADGKSFTATKVEMISATCQNK